MSKFCGIVVALNSRKRLRTSDVDGESVSKDQRSNAAPARKVHDSTSTGSKRKDKASKRTANLSKRKRTDSSDSDDSDEPKAPPKTRTRPSVRDDEEEESCTSQSKSRSTADKQASITVVDERTSASEENLTATNNSAAVAAASVPGKEAESTVRQARDKAQTGGQKDDDDPSQGNPGKKMVGVNIIGNDYGITVIVNNFQQFVLS